MAEHLSFPVFHPKSSAFSALSAASTCPSDEKQPCRCDHAASALQHRHARVRATRDAKPIPRVAGSGDYWPGNPDAFGYRPGASHSPANTDENTLTPVLTTSIPTTLPDTQPAPTGYPPTLPGYLAFSVWGTPPTGSR